MLGATSEQLVREPQAIALSVRPRAVAQLAPTYNPTLRHGTRILPTAITINRTGKRTTP
jgi:hypothetical protein